jgi:hypothetical protein
MRIRQIVFASQELQHNARRLAALLGLDPPFRDPGVGKFGLDNAVFVFGDQFIEIVSPVQSGTTAGRLIDRRGDSGYMLILQTDDFARERARFASLGVRTVFEAEHDDIRAVHLHPKDVGGTIVSVDQPVPAASWRWGGPDWRVQPGRAGEQRIVGVTIGANEPEAMARRWAQVLGLGAPAVLGATQRLVLDGGWVDFEPAEARGDGIVAYALAVADRDAVCARARAAGLPMLYNGFELLGTRIELRAL